MQISIRVAILIGIVWTIFVFYQKAWLCSNTCSAVEEVKHVVNIEEIPLANSFSFGVELPNQHTDTMAKREIDFMDTVLHDHVLNINFVELVRF